MPLHLALVFRNDSSVELAQVAALGRGHCLVQAVVKQHDLWSRGRIRPGAHEDIAGVRVAVHEACAEDLVRETADKTAVNRLQREAA